MILWHDLKAGRSMRWGVSMDERGRGKVDIAAEIQKTLALAHED
jgi:hypothetical protein